MLWVRRVGAALFLMGEALPLATMLLGVWAVAYAVLCLIVVYTIPIRNVDILVGVMVTCAVVALLPTFLSYDWVLRHHADTKRKFYFAYRYYRYCWYLGSLGLWFQ